MSSATMPNVVLHAEQMGPEISEVPAEPGTKVEGVAIILFSSELDKVLAALTIANGAAAMDLPVSMFFTFWGLNVLRRNEPVRSSQKKTMMEGMFGRMMPRGTHHLHVSQLNMAGLGTRLIRGEMRKKHVADLDSLVRSAKEQGVHFTACTMSMDLMGIKKDELIDGVSFGNVASFLDVADRGRITLFI